MAYRQMSRSLRLMLHKPRQSACSSILQHRYTHKEPMAYNQMSRSLRLMLHKPRQSACSSILQHRYTHKEPLIHPNANIVNSESPPLSDDYSLGACNVRRAWAEHNTGKKLPQMAKWLDSIDPNIFRGNIEMPMGLIKLPVAAVGPLTIHGEHAQGDFIAPFATVEGAMTASAQRGIRAINAAGGVHTRTGKQFCSRGPCFVTGSASQAILLANWVKMHKDFLQKEVVSKVSNHAVLDEIMPLYDFEAVHIVFMFRTGDAGGQNVVTLCSWKIMDWIHENVGRALPEVTIKKAWVEANATSDKKSGAFNILHGRGMSTEASVVIPEHILNERLHVTAEQYLKYNYYAVRISQKNTPGGGFNANPANTLMAIFLATGQDAAAVADSIAGNDFSVTQHYGEGGGVVCKATFQNLLVGTMGGGTGLPTQTEGLKMMGCAGSGKVRKLAEIITAFALCLDISTTSAITCGKFADSHERLGRNRPEQ